MAVIPEKFFFRRFSVDADKTNFGLNRDGSSTAVTMAVTSAEGPVIIHRVNFVIVDGSITPTALGGIIGGVTNGIKVDCYDLANDAVEVDWLDGATIKTNADFSMLAGTDVPIDAASGEDALPIRWTIARAGEPLWLEKDHWLRITIQDDLTAITKFEAMAQGVVA